MSRSPYPGFVYLISADNGLVKIGLSANPQRRLEFLLRSVPWPLRLVHQIATDDTRWLEWHLHRLHRPKRFAGEWFFLNDQDIAPLLARNVWNRLDKTDPPPETPRDRQRLSALADALDAILRSRGRGLMRAELLTFWPTKERPRKCDLLRVLHEGLTIGRYNRTGKGKRGSPHTYCLAALAVSVPSLL